MAGAVDDRGDVPVVRDERGERVLHRRSGRDRQQVRRHDRTHLGETVDFGAVAFGDDPDRPAVLGDDDGAVRPFRQQRQRVADGVGGAEGDRCVVDHIAALHPRRDLGNDVGRNVLWYDREAAPSGDGLGHPATGDGGHVRDDDGDRGAGAVVRREIDIES